MIEKVIQNLPLILAVALGVSESLALIPSVKANGIIDLIINILKILLKKE